MDRLLGVIAGAAIALGGQFVTRRFEARERRDAGEKEPNRDDDEYRGSGYTNPAHRAPP